MDHPNAVPNLQPNNVPHSETPATAAADAMCPACGHFSGVYEVCPRCGTYIPKRTTLKFFKLFALVLGIVGLLLLYLWARSREPNFTKIENITPTMNMGAVLIKGEVSNEPNIIYADNTNTSQINYINFKVQDETGEIFVAVYEAEAEDLAEKKLLPHKGDQVEIYGQLKIKAGKSKKDKSKRFISLMLQEIKIKEKAPSIISLPNINETLDKQLVQVQATIGKIQPPREGTGQPYRIFLQENNVSLPLVLWPQTYDTLTQRFVPTEGQAINARVMVQLFENKKTGRKELQLKLDRADDFQIAKITNPAASGSMPTNTSTKPTALQQPANLPPASIIQPPRPVTTFTPTTTKTFTKPELRPIAKVTKDEVGKNVTIEGMINWSKTLAPGLLAEIKDDSGKITTIFDNRRFTDEVFLKKLERGNKIRVSGRVRLYTNKKTNQETIEVSPWNEQDIEFLLVNQTTTSDNTSPTNTTSANTTPPKPTPTTTTSPIIIAKLADIQSNLLHQTVTATGKLVEKKEIAPGVLLILEDNSGKIAVVLFKKVFPADSTALWIEKGKMVTATGQVNEFNKQLQIEPQQPSDVKEIGSPDQAKVIPPEERKMKIEQWDFFGTVGPAEANKLLRFPFPAEVKDRENLPNGDVKLWVRNSTGAMPMILRKERFNPQDMAKWQKGTQMNVQGVIQKLDDELVIYPRADEDLTKIQLQTPAIKTNQTGPTKIIEETSAAQSAIKIADLNSLDTYKNKVVTALLTMVDTRITQPGIKFVLCDGQKNVEAVLLHSAMSNAVDFQKIYAGSKVQVTGTVRWFRGRYQIEMRQANDLVVLQRAETNPLAKPSSTDSTLLYITPIDAEANSYGVLQEDSAATSESSNTVQEPDEPDEPDEPIDEQPDEPDQE